MAVKEAKCPGCQEASEEELLAQLDDILKDYAPVPGAMIPVLQIAQRMFGYLPEAALTKPGDAVIPILAEVNFAGLSSV